MRMDRILKAVPEVVAYLRDMSPMWKDLTSGKNLSFYKSKSGIADKSVPHGMRNMDKVLIAMSGGVDSSVAAFLMKDQGCGSASAQR